MSIPSVSILWQWNLLHWCVDKLLNSVTFSNYSNVCWPLCTNSSASVTNRNVWQRQDAMQTFLSILARNWLILIFLSQVMHMNFLHRGVAGCALCYLLWRKLPLNLILTVTINLHQKTLKCEKYSVIGTIGINELPNELVKSLRAQWKRLKGLIKCMTEHVEEQKRQTKRVTHQRKAHKGLLLFCRLMYSWFNHD